MLLRVGRHSRPPQVAELISCLVRRGASVEIRVIGADALNRAIKAVILARPVLSSHAIELEFVPSFEDVDVEGKSWSAVHLRIDGVRAARVGVVSAS